jgi:hypothetical protein
MTRPGKENFPYREEWAMSWLVDSNCNKMQEPKLENEAVSIDLSFSGSANRLPFLGSLWTNLYSRNYRHHRGAV